jgi:hypothetical protein
MATGFLPQPRTKFVQQATLAFNPVASQCLAKWTIVAGAMPKAGMVCKDEAQFLCGQSIRS